MNAGDRRPVDVFVAASGNAFMTDIAAWIVEAATLLGRSAQLVSDGRSPADATNPRTINLVVAPHEFYVLSDLHDAQIHRSAERSVPVCTEQPGTPWFDMTSLLCAASPVVLDINRHGVDALTERGHDAHHLRIGAVPSMDHRSAVADRTLDLLFLGGRTPHREERLAELAPLLWDRSVDLRLFSFTRPVHGGVGGLVFGDAKYDLLASTRTLLNVHRSAPDTTDTTGGYFEWARLIEAMANGVTVVTEPSTGYEPLVPDEHFVMTDDLPAAVARLLDDRDHAAAIGERAAELVHDDLAFVHALGPVLDLLDRRLGDDASPPRSSPSGVFAPRRSRTPRYRTQLTRARQVPLLPAFRPNRPMRQRIQRSWAAEADLQRRIDAQRCALRFGTPDHVDRRETSAYATTSPEVSVIVSLFDYATVIEETLASVLDSRDVEFEIVIVDDHSTDDGREVVARFMAEHDDVAILLLGSDANRGLPASRNEAFAHARADKVMVLDADNLVYPTCLRRLADALDADDGAAFAYAILEEFGDRHGLQSALGWHVAWLCDGNYIDAQAMIRRVAWEEIGGYRTGDPLMFGWEDWELWLRFAAAGRRGVHVAQILGRYRTQPDSMIATSNLFGDLMLDHLHALHPSLPWPSN